MSIEKFGFLFKFFLDFSNKKYFRKPFAVCYALVVQDTQSFDVFFVNKNFIKAKKLLNFEGIRRKDFKTKNFIPPPPLPPFTVPQPCGLLSKIANPFEQKGKTFSDNSKYVCTFTSESFLSFNGVIASPKLNWLGKVITSLCFLKSLKP